MKKTQRTDVQQVRSDDGTPIAYWTSGIGPPLVLVHGVAADHTRWAPLVPHLERWFTVHAMDRRGRGASGDGTNYSLAKESEDVAAVVDAVADASGTRVYVYGHSHGAFCAYGAATKTTNMRRLVLYEGWPLTEPSVYALPPHLEQRMTALLSAGDREGVVETMFRELVQMSDDDIAAFKAAPSWPNRVQAAHTILREIQGEANARLDPEQATKIDIPVILVTGEQSHDPAKAGIHSVADALPDARVEVLEDQEHVADVLAPQYFARRLHSWLRDPQG